LSKLLRCCTLWLDSEENVMDSKSIRESLLSREVSFGTWIQIGHAAVAEVLAEAGYDWIAVDCEHTDIDVEGFTDLSRGMHGRGPIPLARVRANETLAIRQALDAGAQGVIVPLVNSADEARQAVAAARFPPRGRRGFSFARMNNYGADFDTYAETANQRIAVVVMAESREAVENIDEITSVEGVDGVFVGPYDMSGSYGVPGQTDHERVTEGCRRILKACRRSGKTAGLHVVRPAEGAIERAVADGFNFIALGVDTVFLRRASQEALRVGRSCLTVPDENEE
jgi:2-keto-3-deoxy-L-rhamnonate aldolase RhmA